MQRWLGRLLLPEGIHWVLFLIYLAVLPIAGTIALRNLVLAILVLQSLVYCLATYKLGDRLVSIRGIYSWIVWAGFLLLFPLVAPDSQAAWRELGGQWLLSLLAWAMVFVLVSRISLTDKHLLSIGLASAFYPFLYLGLTLWAWMGGFGHTASASIEDISMAEFLRVLERHADQLTIPGAAGFPWGFRGFDPIHSNLGAAAAQAFIVFAAWGLDCWRRGAAASRLWFWIFLGLMCLVPVIANARASLLSLGFTALLAGVTAMALAWRGRPTDASSVDVRRIAMFGLAALAVLVTTLFLVTKIAEKDSRWRDVYQKAFIGFIIPAPVDVVCNGISAGLAADIRARLAGVPATQVDEILHGMTGDGGRALVMRAGLQLVLDHPLGLDGSRSAYKTLIRERCGKEPAINFVHPHQGWIDLALALGWAGMLLYLGLFMYLLWIALENLSKNTWSGWGAGLLLLCAFWFFRGLLDSVYREHYLQMQGALIGIFWMGMLKKADSPDSTIRPINYAERG